MRKSSWSNSMIVHQAEYRAAEMKTWPSPLEERMKVFLEVNAIPYEQQKIFYIYDKSKIIRYYIADFFLPRNNVIIEMDGKFHDKHKQRDRDRTKDIQNSYPGVEVLRFKWKDMQDEDKMKKLLQKIW